MVKLYALAEAVAMSYGQVADWCYTHQELLVIATSVVVLGASTYLWKKERRRLRKLWRLRRGKQMTRKERDFYIRSKVGDRIGDLLLDMELDGDLKMSESRRLVRQLSQVLNMKGMIPQKKDPPLTADALYALQIFQLRKKVNIPGPKPGEIEPVLDNVVKLEPPRRKFGNLIRR